MLTIAYGLWGNAMGKFACAAALFAAATLQTASAATQCFTAADREAEQALIFQTNLMVVSSACRDPTYAEFRYRNKTAIIAYQHEMIAHFRRAGYRDAQGQFDRWNTSLANEIALKQGEMPTAQVCQQAAEMLKMASTLDAKGFRDYAVAHVASAGNDGHVLCRR
jgi:hypothetical protein